MDDMAQIKPKLTKLKLSGILENLDYHVQRAGQEKMGYTEFLMNLLQDEQDRRHQKQYRLRMKKSGLSPEKSLKAFDFSFNTQVHEPVIRELGTCGFIERRENVFLLGPSGVGKTHLAQALGNEAVAKGYDVMFRNTHHLLKHLKSSKGDGSYDRLMKNLSRIDLLILDDFGLLDIDQQSQETLYELICSRYARSPLIITSNRDLTEWVSVFSNPLLGSAAMDRLVDGTTKIIIEGESYRMRNFILKNQDQPLT